jgi:hypothetical protein
VFSCTKGETHQQLRRRKQLPAIKQLRERLGGLRPPPTVQHREQPEHGPGFSRLYVARLTGIPRSPAYRFMAEPPLVAVTSEQQ